MTNLKCKGNRHHERKQKEDENLVKSEFVPPRETKDNKKTFKSFKEIELSTPFITLLTSLSVERLRFPKENNVSSAIAVPQALLAYNLWMGRRGCY